MRVTMSFNLPEEQGELECAQSGQKYLSIVEELDDFLRSKIKYDQNLNEEQLQVYEVVRAELCRLRYNE